MKPLERHLGASGTESLLEPEAHTTFSWTRSKCTVAADVRSEAGRAARPIANCTLHLATVPVVDGSTEHRPSDNSAWTNGARLWVGLSQSPQLWTVMQSAGPNVRSRTAGDECQSARRCRPRSTTAAGQDSRSCR